MIFFVSVYGQKDTLVQHYRQKALEYQQSIKMSEHSLSGAQSKVEAAKAGMLPQLDFNGRYSYYGVPLQQAPSDIGVPGEELHNFYSLNLDLYQPIITGGYLINTRRVAESETEMMKNLVNMNKQQVMLNADMLYWKAVTRKETYQLHETYKNILGKFLKVINESMQANGQSAAVEQVPVNAPKKRLRGISMSIRETVDLISQNRSLDEVAEQRGISETTIRNHLERFVQEGGKIDLDHLMPSDVRRSRIEAAFKEMGEARLTPVRDALGDDYTWEELAVVRLALRQRQSLGEPVG